MKLKKRIAAALAAVLLLMPMFSASAAPYDGGKMNIISEPGETYGYVKYFKDGEEKPLEELPWVDGGYSGKALALDGVSEYLQLGAQFLTLRTFSFSAFVYWKGSPSGAEGLSGQRLFTVSRNKKQWMSVSPYRRDTSRTDADGRILDGVYFGYQRVDTLEEKWNPARADVESFALPQNEWHHVAVVMGTEDIRMYIDGYLWFTMPIVTYLGELGASSLMIGNGIWGDPTLYALLDNVALYDYDLSSEQVKLLASGQNESDPSATLPSQTDPIYTAPTSSTTTTATVPSATATTARSGIPAAPFGLPWWGVNIIIVVVAVFVLLCVTVNVIEWRIRKKGGGKR